MKITSAQRESLEALAEKRSLRLIVLFGSHVTGRTHEASDLDLAVRTRDGAGISFASRLDLLEDLRGIFPDFDLDLAQIDQADPLFLKQILGNCILLAGTARDFSELKLYAFRRYQDHKPYLAMEQQFVERLVNRQAAAG